MKFSPTKQYEEAKARGSREFLAGKKIEDNPYFYVADAALSSWWQTGFLEEKNRLSPRPFTPETDEDDAYEEQRQQRIDDDDSTRITEAGRTEARKPS